MDIDRNHEANNYFVLVSEGREVCDVASVRCEKNMTVVFLINILEFECTENFSYIFSSYC
jgi:hypothetical protein